MSARKDITTNRARERSANMRFAGGVEAERTLQAVANSQLDKFLTYLPSNYPRNRNTNLAQFFLAVSREFGRLQISASDINSDMFHDTARSEYLFQILGDTLFLGDRAVNEDLSDVEYRDFLIKVRNAYFGGSRKDNIEKSVSDILGLPVILKEVYLRLRDPYSGYSLKDTHRMFFDILMDEVTPNSQVGLLLQDIDFFINMIKPAHVLHETRLVWNDARDNINACVPDYIMKDMPHDIYSTSRIHMVSYLLSKLYKFSGSDSQETWESGTVQFISKDKGWVLTSDNRILVYTDDTAIYERDAHGNDSIVTIDSFSVGDAIRYYGVKDSADNSNVIDTDWAYTDTIFDIDQSNEVILLSSGAYIVYNDNTLIYTRDKDGEYRIEVDDLRIGYEVIFKAKKYTEQFDFYRIPDVVQDNFLKQFDPDVIEKPIFQEYVKKRKDIPEGTTEGPVVEIVDGVATVKVIKSKFYAPKDKKAYRNQITYKYTLYIDNEYKQQYVEVDPERELTREEIKQIFITVYGYTSLEDPNTEYKITRANTAHLVEDGEASILQAAGTAVESCDRKAICQLAPFYEDLRKYHTWPDVQLCSGFFVTQHDFDDTYPGEGAQDIPAWFYLSSDPNSYQVPILPMLGADGDPATIDDLTVYVNGLLVDDAVSAMDPWTGIVTFNFIPPFDTTIRVDYYCADRYPSPQYHLEEYKLETLPSQTGDLPGIFNVITASGVVKRLWWPFEVSDNDLYGDDLDHQVNKFPILNQRGELATKDEIDAFLGTKVTSGDTEIVSVISTGEDMGTTFKVLSGDLTNVEAGDTLIISQENYLDQTLIYVISNVNASAGTFMVPNIVPSYEPTYSYKIIEFNKIPDAVVAVRPLLGHIRINFIPPQGSYLRFNYYFTFQERNYLLVPDAPEGAGFFDYGGSQYTPDTAYGPRNRYTLMVDQNPDKVDQPYWDFDELLKKGYRYRALNLSNSSVLNSEETLILDGYDLYKDRASFKNRGNVLNEFNYMYSPEHLTDTGKYVILNDNYLSNGLVPATQLNKGTPLFIKTYTDDAHHKNTVYADEVDTYDPDLDGGLDLPGSFNIINSDDSGLVDYNGVCDYETNKKITLHTDLKTVESDNGGYDAPLSTIYEGALALPFKFNYNDQYYPNRELRINDYLDYINQVPTEFKTGEITVLRSSSIIKSEDKNFMALRIGDTFFVKNVPFEEWNVDSEDYVTVYKNLPYTLLEIIDFETARLSKPFEGPSGRYDYDLTRSRTYAVDVYLVEVTRKLILNGLIGHTYSLPEPVLKALPGYGDTGMDYELSFPDPDPDPYPRNPGVTGISYPAVAYYPMTGMEIDGKTYRTNRMLGVTGIVDTSNIVESSTTTDPSGALNLGITGPVEYANPRSIDGYDSYQIPAGYTGIFTSYSEAEYRVQWRNWDQDMMFVIMGGDDGILREEPIHMLDDIGDSIVQYFWDVNSSSLEVMTFSGSVIETSEKSIDNVLATSYMNGLVALTVDEYNQIQSVSDPVVDLPELRLGDTNYQLNRRLVREILQDNSVRVTEISEFVPLSET